MGNLKKPTWIELGLVKNLLSNLKHTGQFVQVIVGPRQVGKSTAVQMAFEKKSKKNYTYITADALTYRHMGWLMQQWATAQARHPQGVLIVDEVQKIENWAEAVKAVWDIEQKKTQKMKLVLLGSSSLSLHKGLSESLAGRYQLHAMYHWNFEESHKAYGLSFDEFLTYGGYPGSYPLIKNPLQWAEYVQQSIVDAVIGRDILSLSRVQSPALFKQCFELVCAHPAHVLSYTKLLGQLQTRGNVEKIKHYLNLLEGAFLIRQLFKYSKNDLRLRSSSPKLLPLCPALYSCLQKGNPLDSSQKGHLFEVVVGAALHRLPGDLFYWKHQDFEVDYVYKHGQQLYGIEVKLDRLRSSKSLVVFQQHFPKSQVLVVTPQNYRQVIRRLAIPPHTV